jgi:hypothetical protein
MCDSHAQLAYDERAQAFMSVRQAAGCSELMRRGGGNQGLADEVLQSPKVNAHGWLGLMQLLGGAGDFAALRNGEEGSEQPQVQVVRVHVSLSSKRPASHCLLRGRFNGIKPEKRFIETRR